MKFKVIFAALITLLLASCGYTEPGGEYMVTTLALSGISTGYRVTLQAVNIKEGEQNGLPDTFTVSGRGDRVEAALADAERGLSKGASLAHLDLIVLSDTVGASGVRQIIEVCHSREVTLSAAMAACGDEVALLEGKSPSAGTQLISLIRQNYKSSGFGGHTALYEISTALMVGGGEFALPYLTESPKVEGMLLYRGGEPSRRLNHRESVGYAKGLEGGLRDE